MADEQGPSEGAGATKKPGKRGPKRLSRPNATPVAQLMARGTATSELRSEMRRAIGIAKAIGIRLERIVNTTPQTELPTDNALPAAEWERMWSTYSLNLQRATECQLKLEKEARLRLKDTPTDVLNGHLRGLLERQVADIVSESSRGSKPKRSTKVGA